MFNSLIFSHLSSYKTIISRFISPKHLPSPNRIRAHPPTRQRHLCSALRGLFSIRRQPFVVWLCRRLDGQSLLGLLCFVWTLELIYLIFARLWFPPIPCIGWGWLQEAIQLNAIEVDDNICLNEFGDLGNVHINLPFIPFKQFSPLFAPEGYLGCSHEQQILPQRTYLHQHSIECGQDSGLLVQHLPLLVPPLLLIVDNLHQPESLHLFRLDNLMLCG